MSMVRSMTGFAAMEGEISKGVSFALSLKSVNHRFLDVQLRLPAGYDGLEMALRQLLKARLERGHVEVALEFGRATGSGFEINEAALESIVKSLRATGQRLGLTQEPELAGLLRLPGVMTSEGRMQRQPEAQVMAAVMQAMEPLLVQFNVTREREGAVLADELRRGMTRLREASETVSHLRTGVREAQVGRLRARLEELLAGVGVDQERLLTEAALLAERSDVEEEAVRLRAHADRFLEILDEGGGVGKRLDFLLQELNREANTTLAKTGAATGPDGLAITELGLVMKSEIERAREQVQNLE